MQAIFYDLETSDKEPIGQILNYCFIHVDSDLNTLSELSGNIRISRLQLPRAAAILANRIDVIEHQKVSKDDEVRAMRRISEYLVEISRTAREPIALIGFNSLKFDLPYLRTSMIRNGLNPYAWKQNIVDRDLFNVAKKLAASHPQFPRPRLDNEDEAKLSLKLEKLGQALGLLEGKQSHESRQDVLLSIELARIFRAKFDIDPVSFSTYEAAHLERHQRTSLVTAVVHPNYDLNGTERGNIVPMTLLCANPASALWVNLEMYSAGKGKDSIYYIKKPAGSFTLADSQGLAKNWTEQSQQAQAEFKHINFGNFFSATVCDPEQFIYRLDFDTRATLEQAIWSEDRNKLAALRDMDAKILYKRHLIRTYEWGGKQDQEMEADLRSYALRRYGGEVILAKSPADGSEDESFERFHPTWTKLVAEIALLAEKGSAEDRKLLKSLHTYYLASDINRVAGRQLEALSSAGNPASAA